MKRGGKSTTFRISHWLTSLLSDSYSKNFVILRPFVRNRQAVVLCITRAFQLCVQRGEGAAEYPSHPSPLSKGLEYSSKSHMMALNCWDLAHFWMHMSDYTAETLVFSVRLSNYWSGRGQDLHPELSHVLKWCEDAESCLCSTEQHLIFMR